MSRDVLIYGGGNSEHQAGLRAWAKNTHGLHTIARPDYHRLQIERWLWDKQEVLGKKIMDVGQKDRRKWLGEGYFTFGLYEADLIGDLLEIPLDAETLDGIIVTEVLEHCEDPFTACKEIHRVLKPGGTAMVTSPFVWPDHHTSEYPDFWRFTRQGWKALMKDFARVQIEACKWTDEGVIFYEMLRRFECMGFDSTTEAVTGYMVEAVK